MLAVTVLNDLKRLAQTTLERGLLTGILETDTSLLVDGQDKGQMNEPLRWSTIEESGWALVSAEQRAAAAPETFQIPSRAMRESLSPGDGAKLLFDIETTEGGRIVDRGVDRMWVIVKAKTEEGYIGALDNDPGAAENLRLHERDLVVFGPEHVADIGRPPHDYIVEKHGASFFEE
jgi:hypothetical protein